MNCQNAQSMVLNFINNKLDKEEKPKNSLSISVVVKIAGKNQKSIM